MQGSLGEKIGEGAFSEAYAWAPGQVVKLFKAGVSHLLGRHEVRMIRAVRAAGVPVPEVFGEVTLDGRFGIVLERLDGPTLWHLSRTGAVTFEQAGAIVAVPIDQPVDADEYGSFGQSRFPKTFNHQLRSF